MHGCSIRGGRGRFRAGRAPAVLAVSCLLSIPSRGAAGGEDPRPLRLRAGSSSITVEDADRPVLHYRLLPSPNKPYVGALFTPSGINVLRDAPHDHLHHHALMFAVGVEGVDFWGEQEGAGKIRHREIASVASLSASGVEIVSFTQGLDWVGPEGGPPMAREARTIDVIRGPDPGASLLTWETRLEAGPGRDAIRLDGQHYFGLGLRFVVSMDEGGEFVTPEAAEAKPVRGTETLRRSRWCAYMARAGGRPVTVAVFDHPENPRHPATWFTMTAPFAYLSATLELHEKPYPVEKGKPLSLRYGVAAWDGHPPPDRIEALYGAWRALLATRVKSDVRESAPPP